MTGASPFRAEPAAAIIDRFNTAWTTQTSTRPSPDQ
jgi:hypothetical protein